MVRRGSRRTWFLNMVSTSATLLEAIGADPGSPRWTEFVARYRPVMEAFLSDFYPSVSAEDVMQETLIVLVRKLPDYHYDPDVKGRFKSWLLGILKNKAREALRRQGKIAKADGAAKEFADVSQKDRSQDGDDADWRIAAYEVALQQLLANPNRTERTRQIFIRTALKGEDPVKVAALFGTTRNNVDQIKNRLTAELRELATRLADE